MPELISRIDDVAKSYLEEISLDEYDEIHNQRFLSVYYYTKGDVNLCKKYIPGSAKSLLKLFQKLERGGSVSFSYLDDDSYRYLWDALASGDWQISKKLMEYIYKYNQDGKDSFPPEWIANTNLKKSTPFDRYFNYMFQMAILGIKHDKNVFEDMRNLFLKKHKSYAGYPLCFEAIYHQDKEAFESGIKEVMKGHRRLCRSGAEFGDTVDEIIAIWPLGLINLARMKGMDVSVEDELVPKDLLAEVGIAK